MNSQSRVFVADRKNNRVQAFTPTGDFIAKYTGLNAPQDVDAADNILVTDTGNKRMVVLRWSGTSLVLDHGVSNAAFSTPIAVAHGATTNCSWRMPACRACCVSVPIICGAPMCMRRRIVEIAVGPVGPEAVPAPVAILLIIMRTQSWRRM